MPIPLPMEISKAKSMAIVPTRSASDLFKQSSCRESLAIIPCRKALRPQVPAERNTAGDPGEQQPWPSWSDRQVAELQQRGAKEKAEPLLLPCFISPTSNSAFRQQVKIFS